MENNLLAAIFALASALTIAWGTVVRHRIAKAVPAGKSPFLTAIKRPMWWAGMSTAIMAYCLQVVALGFGPLLVVQPILVMSLIFTIPVAAIYDNHRVSKAELFWASLLTVSVSVMVILGRPIGGQSHPSFSRWWLALLLGVLVLFVMDRVAKHQKGRNRALILGLVTGAIFGYVAVLSKAVADSFVSSGVLGLIISWESYALIFAATMGTLVQQSAFNASSLRTSLPAMKIAEPIIAFGLGFAVLGESFRVDGFDWIWLGVAFFLMVLSTVVLSRRNVT
ncbi:DMT family transporter [Corynebacterium occultum]|uniref:DMT family transporter n=1 Tax=Corynebacterium occultum TaxID=2675219 RepID=UPI0012E13DD8|nr:DMT family transporter [Corynebacterium occultum]